MPNRWVAGLIVLFWLIMTAAVVRRDILPRLGYGELDYRTVLSARAVEEPVQWSILLSERRIGAATTFIRPQPDGSYDFVSRGSLSAALLGENVENPADILLFRSEFVVSPLGRLDHFEASIAMEGSSLRVVVKGTVEEDKLRLETRGLAFLEKDAVLSIDPESLLVDPLGPLDRLPGLRVGKSWTTRVVNPLSALISPRAFFSSSRPSVEVVHHRVVGFDSLSWGGRPRRCYLVEHRHGSVVGKTWARVEDGKVLRQEVPVGGWILALELDPQTFRQTAAEPLIP